jgi:hypothetical protein
MMNIFTALLFTMHYNIFTALLNLTSSLRFYTLAFALQLRKTHGRTSVRVAQYKNNEQYNTQMKNSHTKQYDVTEQRTEYK